MIKMYYSSFSKKVDLVDFLTCARCDQGFDHIRVNCATKSVHWCLVQSVRGLRQRVLAASGQVDALFCYLFLVWIDKLCAVLGLDLYHSCLLTGLVAAQAGLRRQHCVYLFRLEHKATEFIHDRYAVLVSAAILKVNMRHIVANPQQ